MIGTFTYHNTIYFFARRFDLLPLVPPRFRRSVLSVTLFLGLTPSTLASATRRSNTLSAMTCSEGPARVACLPESTSAHAGYGLVVRHARPAGTWSAANAGGIEIM